MMLHRSGLVALFAASLTLVQCKTPGVDSGEASSIKSAGGPGSVAKGNNVDALPVVDGVDEAANAEAVFAALKSSGIPDAKRRVYANRIGHYLSFLGQDATSAAGKKVLSRLMSSSMQFIICDDFNDWECLEQKPVITPRSAYRQDTQDDLGAPVDVPEAFNMEYWFTEAWDKDVTKANPSQMLALHLAEKINTEAVKRMSMAVYGIDDIKKSMKPVYDAIIAKLNSGVDVRAVVDTNGVNKLAPKEPLVLAFAKPTGGKAWAFDPVQTPKTVNTNIEMQYNGTVALMEALNKGAKNEDEYRARIEWPNRGIMHNKFVVFDRGNGKSVWTGTSNVTETCMGTERNSNVGIFINSTAIADTYQAEFEEMYTYQEQPVEDPKLLNAKGKPGVKLGLFHTDKTPNTKRYFRFNDGTEARVHFAPTDDGEHRVILPMLLSAQKGDIVRISMFGAGGIELVRAMQYAEAKGALVWIVLDCVTGTPILRGATGTVLDPNPYAKKPDGQILVRRSTWKKLNHHKTATLTRATPQGEQAMMAVIGSQNWSVTGNDQNDENMVTIRATEGELQFAKDFNEHFDKRLWVVAEKGELVPNKPYKEQGSCKGDSDGDDPDAAAEAEQ